MMRQSAAKPETPAMVGLMLTVSAPKFEERSGGVAVELLKAEVSEKTVSEKASGKAGTPVKTPVKTPEAILSVLKENSSLTLAEVADRIEKSVSAVERATKKLKDQGRLKYVGPQKGGHWEVIG